MALFFSSVHVYAQDGEACDPNLPLPPHNPDLFDARQAAAGENPLNVSSRFFIFSIPVPYYCQGAINTVQLCYETEGEVNENFIIYIMELNAMNSNVMFIGRHRVSSTPSDNLCVDDASGTNIRRICCDQIRLTNDILIQHPGNFIGVETDRILVVKVSNSSLAGLDLFSENNVVPNAATVIQLSDSNRVSTHFPLLRFYAGNYIRT